MNNQLVSIIIPIYNVDKYLKQCIESVLEQTYPFLQVILVNDGSTDNSLQIAKHYESQYTYVSVIDKRNGGASSARNLGISLAKGKYIYFLDGDDYLEKEAIETLVNLAEKEYLDVICFSAYSFLDGKNNYEWTEESGYKYKGEYSQVYSGRDLLEVLVEKQDMDKPSCCLIFIRRDVISTNHLRFWEGITFEDNLFHLELLLISERVIIYNRPLYYRRVRSNSVMSSNNWEKAISAMRVTLEQSTEFVKNNQMDMKIIAPYQKFFAQYAMWCFTNVKGNIPHQVLSDIHYIRKFIKKNQYWNCIPVVLNCYFPNFYRRLREFIRKIRTH